MNVFYFSVLHFIDCPCQLHIKISVIQIAGELI